MNSKSKYSKSENGEFTSSPEAVNGEVVEPTMNTNLEVEAKRRAELVEWLNDMVPYVRFPLEASEEELRACLTDGTVFCSILNRLRPGSVDEVSSLSSESQLGNVTRFLSVMDEMGLPKFELLDLVQGSMKPVLGSLWALREQFNSSMGEDNTSMGSSDNSSNHARRRWNLLGEEIDGSLRDASSHGQNSMVTIEERRKITPESKFKRVLRSPVMSEPSAALMHHVGHKFHEVFQLKQGRYADLSDAKILEMMKSNSLDNAPTQSLLSVMNGILDEGVDKKNGEIPHRVACLLKKVVQEIERRISAQAEHIRTQNNLYKVREEKYQSRIRVLETLATGTSEETQVLTKYFQSYLYCSLQTEKTKIEERKKLEEQDVVRLMKEKDQIDVEISTLRQELEKSKKSYEQHCVQLETQSKEAQVEFNDKLKELEGLLRDSRNKETELEVFSESKAQNWNRKEKRYQSFMDFQFQALQELRLASESVKQEVVNSHRSYAEEFSCLGAKLKGLADAAENYHMVLAENRRLYNEVQDLKGNIRVYCRVRPFLSGQNKKQTTIEYIGENGELVVANPSKQGKESHRSFKFNKVFSPAATQEEVFLDTQPLIRSVLDGYNVCIFAYGQTGSGKTYTMTGPDASSEKNWGVNYRALNDLFQISQNRRSSFIYEVGVQMVEIYNEQVRDLLSSGGSQKRYPLLIFFRYVRTIVLIICACICSQPNGIAVPDASMHPVKSTSDVLELMQIGLMNRAVGATALNERSSRSHSVLTVHVRGTDLETEATLRGSLHLVDLAGSERVDRSEVTGDRLREAQHINKSLSALGDVIFALSQKSSHVPYRNSKLTQVLQSSLGGQAKTLMFVQLNPDADSYSETLSTLKFAERVSGVELGAARSNKEGKDVRELMEQMASLKEIVAKKDEEIDRLQSLKDLKSSSFNTNGEKRGLSSLRHGPSSPRRHSLGGGSRRSRTLSVGKGLGLLDKAASDQDNCSEYSDKHSETGSHQSMEDFRHHKEFFRQSKLAVVNAGEDFSADVELVGFGDAESEERLSDISDGGLSMGTETDGSISSIVEFTLFPEGAKPAENTEKAKAPTKIPRPLPQKPVQPASVRPSVAPTKLSSTSVKKTTTGSSSGKTPTSKRWQ
ncbi:Calponin homology domain [Macleaya cordata]|uniref:Calponin homology domain n=1 Tax=Macleaya cordata TaxID=56857 RepID=A0A200QUA8_MACCD|nr:Calponin homology domain [Macleaya cordata]